MLKRYMRQNGRLRENVTSWLTNRLEDELIVLNTPMPPFNLEHATKLLRSRLELKALQRELDGKHKKA